MLFSCLIAYHPGRIIHHTLYIRHRLGLAAGFGAATAFVAAAALRAATVVAASASTSVVASSRVAAIRGIRTIRGLLLGLYEVLDIHEGGLLLEHLRREVVDIGTAGGEAEEQALDVDTEVVVVLLVGTGALDREIEGAEFTELHLLAFQELLEHTVLQLVGNAQTDVFTIHRVVLGHVLTELLIAHGLRRDHATIPLAEGCRLVVLVLSYFYEYGHNF